MDNILHDLQDAEHDMFTGSLSSPSNVNVDEAYT